MALFAAEYLPPDQPPLQLVPDVEPTTDSHAETVLMLGATTLDLCASLQLPDDHVGAILRGLMQVSSDPFATHKLNILLSHLTRTLFQAEEETTFSVLSRTPTVHTVTDYGLEPAGGANHGVVEDHPVGSAHEFTITESSDMSIDTVAELVGVAEVTEATRDNAVFETEQKVELDHDTAAYEPEEPEGPEEFSVEADAATIAGSKETIQDGPAGLDEAHDATVHDKEPVDEVVTALNTDPPVRRLLGKSRLRERRREVALDLASLQKATLDKDGHILEERVKDALVENFIGLAKYFANKFTNRGVDDEELEQVALVALVDATKRFQPDMGVEFIHYASRTIEGNLQRYFRDFRTVRTPRSMYELWTPIRAAIKALEVEGVIPNSRQIADYMNSDRDTRKNKKPITADLIAEVLRTGTGYAVSLDTNAADRDTTRGDLLTDDLDFADDAVTRVVVQERLDYLAEYNETKHDLVVLIKMRHGIAPYNGRFARSQQELAEHFGVTQMHISRLLRQAYAIILRDPRAVGLER